ncbi:Two-component system, NtrC family, C4-dicarboxylate transport sensor histidine kinase DctB [Pseudomonas sp. 8Z]|uniref:sensor histidine kinase n=1 Tax=Pseudomonas sp. 8Z TaxID=2653166 RepID=UPI0012EF388B|nr:ATP-binding protein [Pseudomonas sp. 8Z]VXD04653.1 Two-component system, NtrC family, C4-dicarboxylate transport sensor histidine kinase DctB [Pseudomonas sp. 8Z]
MPVLRPRYRVLFTVLAILAGLLLSVWLGGRYAERHAWDERSVESRGQLQLYAQSIRTLVERFSSVPEVLALDSDIKALLRTPDDQSLRQALNLRLERLNAAAGSTVLYLLDTQGEALVASNWRDWSSFVGNNYAFRPYFQDALRNEGARYFAVGVTTGIPGYFLSHVVRDDDGRLLGVLVVKLELEELQRDWVGQPGVLLVADSYQVVILSNRPAWRFRALQPLNEAARAELVEVRKYAEQSLQSLASVQHRRIDADAEWARVDGPDGPRDYLWQRLLMPEEGWTLHLLSEPSGLADSVRSYRLAAAGVWTTLAFLLLFLVQRRKNQRLQAGIRERLEREVELRTSELREAQEGLVHAAKMAALGQMSAALAHEINQPLTALQMQLGSLRLLLDSGRPEAVRDGLQRVDGLLQRMAALTGHLKTFARKSPAGLSERLSLADVLEQALQLLAPRMRSEQVELRREVDAGAQVLGDAIRLEQVILNLLHNALDAMVERDTRVLLVRIARDCDDCVLSVEDSGGGIAEQALGRVFEPFFTTKPVGQGLGLGLAVSYGIVRDLGGSLEADNSELGAVFTLRLPAA